MIRLRKIRESGVAYEELAVLSSDEVVEIEGPILWNPVRGFLPEEVPVSRLEGGEAVVRLVHIPVDDRDRRVLLDHLEVLPQNPLLGSVAVIAFLATRRSKVAKGPSASTPDRAVRDASHFGWVVASVVDVLARVVDRDHLFAPGALVAEDREGLAGGLRG